MAAKKKTKVILVGFFNNHVVGSKVELLKKLGYDVHAFDVSGSRCPLEIYGPDSMASFPSDRKKPWDEFRELGRNLGLTREDEREAGAAEQLLNRVQPDLIWGVWGAGILRWLRVLRRIGYKGKIVWTANVFPNRIRLAGLTSEPSLYRQWLPKVDGIIVTSQRMQNHIQRAYPTAEQCRYLIMPDYMPRSWYAQETGASCSNGEPHVVYLGAPDRHGASWLWAGMDKVDDHLMAIAETGVHVHCARPKRAAIEHPRIHFYEQFSDSSFVKGEFAQYANQFDATIVLYNYRKQHPRFASTFPTRFLISLCARVPIFVKSGILTSCEEFVLYHGLGRVYETAKDLRETLGNKHLMRELREKAEKAGRLFASDDGENACLVKDFLASFQ